MNNTCDFDKYIRDTLNVEQKALNTYSPLTLAFIGDSIYDLIIRSYVVGLGNVPNKKLHKQTVGYVSAVAQARIIEELKPQLTDEELTIYKRGKNSKPTSKAKNATEKEYLKATGFEALIGYLYLKGDMDRLMELIQLGTGLGVTKKQDE